MRTVSHRPLDQLNRDWEATCHTPAARTAAQLLSGAEPAVAALGPVDLGDLLAAIAHPADTGARDAAAQIIQAMLRSGRLHPLIPRATLQAIVPGLVSVGRRLSWGAGGEWGGSPGFTADLLATAWEVIVAWGGQDRPFAVLDLLSATRLRLQRQRAHGRAQRATPMGDLDADHVPRTLWTLGPPDLERMARAIDDLDTARLGRFDAAVLYGNCVLGLSITEMARMSGTSRRFVGERRNRAARELLA